MNVAINVLKFEITQPSISRCNAKYLWKRIPQNVKSSHSELNSIWKVGQKMWLRDFPGVYAALNTEWSENVSQIMQALQGLFEYSLFLISWVNGIVKFILKNLCHFSVIILERDSFQQHLGISLLKKLKWPR